MKYKIFAKPIENFSEEVFEEQVATIISPKEWTKEQKDATLEKVKITFKDYTDFRIEG